MSLACNLLHLVTLKFMRHLSFKPLILVAVLLLTNSTLATPVQTTSFQAQATASTNSLPSPSAQSAEAGQPVWQRKPEMVLSIGLGALVIMGSWVWLLGRNVQRRMREIAASENKLRAIFNASPDAMWVKDAKGVYRDYNDRLFDILHVPKTNLTGLSDDILLEAHHRFHFDKPDSTSSQDTSRVRYQISVQTDAGMRHVEVIEVPLYGADGSVEGMLGAARDITDRLNTEAQLRLWAHAFQYAAFGVVIFDAQQETIIMANPTFAKERGYTPDEMVGLHADDLYPEDLVEERRLTRAKTGGYAHLIVETEQITRDCKRFPVQLDISISRDAQNKAQYVIVYAQDISARKQAEHEVRLAAVAFQSQDAMIILDENGLIQRVNPSFTALTGYSSQEAIGQTPRLIASQQHDEAFYQDFWKQVRKNGHWQGEQWIQGKHGSPRIARIEVSAVMDESGWASQYIGTLNDLTSVREAHARAEHMTFFDPLTDLPNRNYLITQLVHHFDDANAPCSALLHIDLDHFKRINELRGHSTGDRLLSFITQRLRPLVHQHDILSRLSGGSFVLFLKGHSVPAEQHTQTILAEIKRIQTALQEPFWLGDDLPTQITVSIGWTRISQPHDSVESILKEAELAMYAAKAAGRNRACRFEASMLEELEYRETLISELAHAITNNGDGLELHLQLQTNTKGHAIGAESLLRWTRNNGQRIPPDTFIPLAEDSGLIVPLGQWVIRRTCQILASWANQPHLHALTLAANVSAKQFAQADFVSDVLHSLREAKVAPNRLKLEITESAILGNLDAIRSKLAQLRDAGIRISLDDFGTGYSSLTYLSRLPLDQLKIDRSFVIRLPDDQSDATLAQTIIGMGHGLGLDVIAEGVETEAQCHFLSHLGCDAFQGYYFAKPLPLHEFTELIEQRQQMH